MAEEGLKTTPNKLIHIGMPIAFDNDEFLSDMKELENYSRAEDDELIIKTVKRIVTTYHSPEETNGNVV